MKKQLFFLAAGAIAMASCTSDEVVSVNPGSAIEFATALGTNTRATTPIETTNGLSAAGGFYVMAQQNDESLTTEGQTSGKQEIVIDDKEVTMTDAGKWKTADTYYWPNFGVDFYAYSKPGAGVTKTNYNQFTIIPATSGDQCDFLYANTMNVKKTTGAVTLNFRHALSQINCKVYNSKQDFITATVQGWKIGFVDGSGVFTYNDANTDGRNAGTDKKVLAYTDWSGNTDVYTALTTTKTQAKNIDNAFYTRELADPVELTAATKATAVEIVPNDPMILVPQEIQGFVKDEVDGMKDNDAIRGAYLAVKVKYTYVLTAATAYEGWAYFPLKANTDSADKTWKPGYKYTYIIDLSNGGYKEPDSDPEKPGTDPNDDDDDDDPDPIFKNMPIEFEITVDAWDTTPGEIDLGTL